MNNIYKSQVWTTYRPCVICHFTQIYRARYGDAMLVPTWAGGNEIKHLVLICVVKAILLFPYELADEHTNIFPNA